MLTTLKTGCIIKKEVSAMKIKKLPILTAVLALTACTARQTDKPVTETAVTSETVTVKEVFTSETTTAETTNEETTNIETTNAETTTAPVTLYEFNKHTKENRTYVEITDSTPFYSCSYDKTGLCDGQDFTDTALLEKAEAALVSSQAYAKLYDEIKERMPDKEPALKYSCTKVLPHDLDGDGTDEYAFLFSFSPDFSCTDEEMVQTVWGAIDPNTPYALVLYGGGEFYTNNYRYAMNSELAVLDYGEFAQFCISGGVSNNSSCADYFSFYDGKFEHELREFQTYDIKDGGFLVHTMAQASNSWIIFWNDEIKGYVTPEAVHVSREERDEIFEQLPLDDEQRERFKEYNICIIGNKYYSLYGDMLHTVSFIKENDGFVPIEKVQWNSGINERKMPYDRPFEIPYAVNFDYDKAAERMIKE